MGVAKNCVCFKQTFKIKINFWQVPLSMCDRCTYLYGRYCISGGKILQFSVFTDTNFNGPYGAPGRYQAYPLDKVLSKTLLRF
jgi:hypothetical protein